MRIANSQMSMASGAVSSELMMKKENFGNGVTSSSMSTRMQMSGSMQMNSNFNLSHRDAIGKGLSFSEMIKSRGTQERKEEAEKTLSEIRQKSILYLLDILFAYRSKERNWRTSLGQMSGLGSNVNLVSLGDYYEQETYYLEQQEAAFQTTGTVMTEDGRSISFDMNVYMSSRFEAYYQEQYGTQSLEPLQSALCDPLVINLSGDIAEVKDQTFFFDLDADGTVENIHKLNAGSGYLALDQNKDGIINDGSELFGTKSGDGFADLAKYDEDHNGWIDENDSIFEQLKIWVQDGDGNGSLYSLKEQNVGAICLNNAPTYINQYDKNGAVSAVIRSTGMFLFENGRAGTMQHLDMAT